MSGFVRPAKPVEVRPSVIFDIDGTLADTGHRSKQLTEVHPKDWGQYNGSIQHDTPKHDIVEIARLFDFARYTILLCTGRQELCMQETVVWLKMHAIPYHRLYMRKTGDHRDDSIVKSELLDQMLADGYSPRIAYEDRARVVEMWRARGLTCCQVAPGDF